MHRWKVVTRFGLAAFALVSGQFVVAAQPETPDAQAAPIHAKADLVLSSEFCKTVKRFGLIEAFRVGKSACEQLPLVLKDVFGELRVVQGDSGAENARGRLTVTPRFVTISVTDQPMLPSSRRKFLVVLEWTVKDPSGKLLWLQTVQAAAERKAWTRKIARALVEDAVRELATESVLKMQSSPELASLSGK